LIREVKGGGIDDAADDDFLVEEGRAKIGGRVARPGLFQAEGGLCDRRGASERYDER
jgi:hypothetical protein